MASEATLPSRRPAGRRARAEPAGGARAACRSLGQYARLHPRARPVRGVLRRPARAHRRVQLLEGRRLQRRPRLDARQLPLLLQRRRRTSGRCGRRSGCRVAADRAHDRDRVSLRLLARPLRAAAAAEARCSSSSSCRSGRATCCACTRGSTSSASKARSTASSQWTGITDHPLSFFLYDRPAVILVLVYLYFPFAALTLYASLERFDWDQFKAAMDLGATPADRDRAGSCCRRSSRGSRRP